MEIDFKVWDTTLRTLAIFAGIYIIYYSPKIYQLQDRSSPLTAAATFLFFGTVLTASAVWAQVTLSVDGDGLKAE
ncbi:hypothetical protein, partial [Labrenzia sp. 011]|uniref:hypothetical protein n=1 Tax=Labrenzia sp. 011 TaxID=2171494 RepID=UPI00105703E3